MFETVCVKFLLRSVEKLKIVEQLKEIRVDSSYIRFITNKREKTMVSQVHCFKNATRPIDTKFLSNTLPCTF